MFRIDGRHKKTVQSRVPCDPLIHVVYDEREDPVNVMCARPAVAPQNARVNHWYAHIDIASITLWPIECRHIIKAVRHQKRKIAHRDLSHKQPHG